MYRFKKYVFRPDMFRKPAKRKEQTIRTREREEVDGDASADIVKDLAKRKRRDNPMIQSVSFSFLDILLSHLQTKKKDEKQDNASSSSSDEEIVNEHAYPASGTDAPLGPLDRGFFSGKTNYFNFCLGATFTTEKDTSYDADAQSQFERVQQILKEGGVEKVFSSYSSIIHKLIGRKGSLQRYGTVWC